MFTLHLVFRLLFILISSSMACFPLLPSTCWPTHPCQCPNFRTLFSYCSWRCLSYSALANPGDQSVDISSRIAPVSIFFSFFFSIGLGFFFLLLSRSWWSLATRMCTTSRYQRDCNNLIEWWYCRPSLSWVRFLPLKRKTIARTDWIPETKSSPCNIWQHFWHQSSLVRIMLYWHSVCHHKSFQKICPQQIWDGASNGSWDCIGIVAFMKGSIFDMSVFAAIDVDLLIVVDFLLLN